MKMLVSNAFFSPPKGRKLAASIKLSRAYRNESAGSFLLSGRCQLIPAFSCSFRADKTSIAADNVKRKRDGSEHTMTP
jgi:hypothetical protein